MTSPQAVVISQLSIITGFIFISHLMVTSRDCNKEDGVTILIWAVEDIGITVNMHQVYESFIVVVSHNQMKSSLCILCATVKRCWSH